MRRTTIVSAGIVAIALAGAGPVVALPAAAAPLQSAVRPAAQPHRECSWLDFGQGLIMTTALGSPGRTVGGVRGAGVVEVRPSPYVASQPVVLTSTAVGIPAQKAGRFGAAVVGAQVSFSDDCADLVVGMPGADGGRGAVVLIPDTGSGFDPSHAVRLATDSLGLKSGDALGTALGVVQSAKGTLVVAGAPGRDLPGAKDAGALVSWWIPIDWSGATPAPATASIPTPGAPVAYRQGTGGMLGKSEAGDRFGSVISTTVSSSRITVGIPKEDVGRAKDTGAVARLTFSSGSLAGNDLMWQGHRLPGRSRSGDQLGAAVVDIGYAEAYGIPGENANGRADSGAVLVRAPGQSTFRTITQNTRGVPDTSEKGDRFGAALAAGSGIVAQESATIAVGVPGENANHADTGAVTLVTWSGTSFGYTRLKVPGLTAGDRLGSDLVVVSDEPDAEEDTIDVLLAGAPGEDRPGAKNAGRYYLAARPTGAGAATVYADGRSRGEAFGQ